jgi:thiol-disulfide isomerase/thioredoxin
MGHLSVKRTLIKSVIYCTSAASVMMGGLFAGEIGMDAPPLRLTSWIKGGETSFSEKNDTIYVVEFWATWCGPCRQSIPHLSQLQEKYADMNVRILGISDEKVDIVKKFVANMGDKMNYTVAVSEDRFMHNNYMKAFGAMGIPHAFVVNKDLKIVWEGHPLSDLDSVLEKLVNGGFDMAQARMVSDQKKKEGAILEKMRNYFKQAVQSAESTESMSTLGNEILDEAGKSANLLNQFSWTILTHGQIKFRDRSLALAAALQSFKLTNEKNANVADTLARAYWESGDKSKAIEIQQLAIDLASGDEEKIQAFKAVLHDYQSKQ